MSRGTLVVFLFLFIGGCASQRVTRPNEEILECPTNEYLVCRGGTVSRIGDANQRDPRFCSCQPKEQIN